MLTNRQLLPTLVSLVIGIKQIVIVITAFSVPKISTHQQQYSQQLLRQETVHQVIDITFYLQILHNVMKSLNQNKI
jgi:hypothetical protein